jgi:radical SAM protein with 4Fe4S-binding SPASM domain
LDWCVNVECSLLPEIELEEWAGGFWKRARAERWPLCGSIELTFRCNLNCVHCYCNLPPGDKKAISEELTSDEIREIIDQAVAEGCLWLCFTGGEPLLRPDFLDLYAYAKSKGLFVILFTNATLINERLADYLAEWPPRRTEVTLYGATEGTYEAVTRVPGSYARCMRGVEILLDRGLKVILKTTVTTLNRHEVPDIRRHAESCGVEYRYDPLLLPRLDGTQGPTEYRISPQEVVELDRIDERRIASMRELCEKYWGPESSDRLYTCGAGQNTFHIDPYGALGLCITNRYHTYPLREGSFKEGWHEYIAGVRSLTVGEEASETECRTCDKIALCGQCPAWSYLEHGDLQSPVNYLCEVAQLRAELLFGDRAFDDVPEKVGASQSTSGGI